MDWWILSHAETQRAQRVFWSCDFAQGIAEWDWGIGGLGDWRIDGLEDWKIGGLGDWGLED